MTGRLVAGGHRDEMTDRDVVFADQSIRSHTNSRRDRQDLETEPGQIDHILDVALDGPRDRAPSA
jgi:hypothetical protein